MLSISSVGQIVVMKHIPTGELHVGEVVDGDDDYAVLKMDATAKLFIDNDINHIDTRFDRSWQLEKICGAQSYGTTYQSALVN